MLPILYSQKQKMAHGGGKAAGRSGAKPRHEVQTQYVPSIHRSAPPSQRGFLRATQRARRVLWHGTPSMSQNGPHLVLTGVGIRAVGQSSSDLDDRPVSKEGCIRPDGVQSTQYICTQTRHGPAGHGTLHNTCRVPLGFRIFSQGNKRVCLHTLYLGSHATWVRNR